MEYTKNITSEDGKGKIVLNLEVLGLTFSVVKLYREDEVEFDEALEDAETALTGLLKKGLPDNSNHRIKYLIDEQTREETKELHTENQ